MRSFDDEIWDEVQWEEHLREMEHKSEQIRTYIESSLGEHSPRWSRFLTGFTSKLDAIDAYIEDELMFEDAYFPDDEDDWDDEDEEMDDFFLSTDSAEEEDEDIDEGEEWKRALSKDDIPFDPMELDSDQILTWVTTDILDEIEEAMEMELYDESRELAADMLRLAEIVPKDEQDENFIKLISETVNTSTKLAGAFAFGFDLDVLGGNIAYCRRALNSANNVLELLYLNKHKSYMRFVDYESLHERMFDLRNDIGVHVQDLREELNEGLASGEI